MDPGVRPGKSPLEENEPSRRGESRWRRNLLALGLGIVAACALGEFAVRALDLPPRMLASLGHQNFVLSDDPILRYEYRPGFDGPLDERALSFPINRDGLRDYVYPEAKPEGVTRILLLGDSVAAGNGVRDLAKILAKQLEGLLNRGRAGRPIEVLNMAVGGYNTLQEVELLRVRGLAYHPDVVVVCFCINDFAWSSDGGVFKRLKAQLQEQGAGGFARIRSAPDGWMTWVLRHSRFAFALYGLGSGLLDRRTHRVAMDDYEMRGSDPVEMGLRLLGRLEENGGFRSILCVIPGLNRPFSRYEQGQIHERVRAVARDAMPSLPVVDLLEDMRKVTEDPTGLTFDGLHLTEKGHRVVAEVMALHLVELLAQR